eukprot:747216-Prymnesium_polylepis.1
MDLTWDAVQAATAACRCAPKWDAAQLTLARAQLNLGEPRLALRSAEAALSCWIEAGEEGGRDGARDIEDEIEHVEVILLRQHMDVSAGAAGAPTPVGDVDLLQRAAVDHGHR